MQRYGKSAILTLAKAEKAEEVEEAEEAEKEKRRKGRKGGIAGSKISFAPLQAVYTILYQFFMVEKP